MVLATPAGPMTLPGPWLSLSHDTTRANPRAKLTPSGTSRRRRSGDPMSTITAPAPGETALKEPPPLSLERRHWLAALAILFVFFTPYQTLVQTVITDDAVRLGVE